MRIREIREDARNAYHDNWGKYIGLNFVYFLVVFAVSFIISLIPIVGPIATMVLSIPLAFGYTMNLVKLKKGETTKITDFLSLGMNNFGKAWAVYGWTLVKLILWFILFMVVVVGFSIATVVSAVLESYVVLGIVSVISVILMVVLYVVLIAKALLYMLAQIVAAYNENMLAKDSVEHSAKLMKGNRFKYIGLALSFTGWIILASLTCGMGFIFLAPYMSLATISFYESLDKKEESPVVTNV